jgi:hypothetical protein
MTSCDVSADPESREWSAWIGRLVVLESRGASDDDTRVIQCRQALAYCRLQPAVAAETGQLSWVGIERLGVQLREAVAR